jgi:hypothetical protein
MNADDEKDIRSIYSQSLEPTLLTQFIHHLDGFLSRHQDELRPISIPEGDGRLRGHFSIFHNSNRSKCLFAGAVDSDDYKEDFPILRLDSHNERVNLLDDRFKFPYRKTSQRSNDTNVILQKDTIRILPELLEAQLRWFIQRG